MSVSEGPGGSTPRFNIFRSRASRSVAVSRELAHQIVGTLDARLVAPAAGCWLAALWALRQPASHSLWLAGLSAVLVVAVLLSTSRAAWLVVAVACAGVCLGATTTGARVAMRDASPVVSLAEHHSEVTATVALVDDPRSVSSGPAGTSTFLLRATLIGLETAGGGTARDRKGHAGPSGQAHAVDIQGGERIVVFARGCECTGLLPGQRLRFVGRLAPARPTDLTAATLSVSSRPELVGKPSVLQRAAGKLRAGLRGASNVVPQPSGGLIPALTVGDTAALQPELAEQFRITGMTHLTAVSGANLAIVVGAVLLVARSFGAGSVSSAALAGCALVGFVVLARPSPSVLRAAAMAAIALIALAASRPRSALPALGFAIIALIVYDPTLSSSPGFVLSVLATLGLVVLAPSWAAALRARGIPRGLAELLAVPLAAQLACLPFIAGYSGAVSLVAVPANVAASLAVGPITVLGVAAALCSALWDPLGGWSATALAWLAGWPARWLTMVAEHASRWQYAQLHWPSGLGGALLATVAIGVLCLIWRQPVTRWSCVALIVGLLLVLLPMQLRNQPWPPPGWLMAMCDVGQGDAAVLRVGPGSGVVIDAGPEPVSVNRCLSELGIQHVPLFVLSHPHADHVGGVDGVSQGRDVSAVLVGQAQDPPGGYRRLLNWTQQIRAPLLIATPTWRQTIGDATLTVIGPQRSLSGTRSPPNDNSVVLLVQIAGITALFPGDVEHAGQRELLSSGVVSHVDVLKVPHHGSAYSEPEFFDTVTPRAAVVSVGAHNDYGHPSETVLRYLGRGGALVARTDRGGDVAIVSSSGRVALARHAGA